MASGITDQEKALAFLGALPSNDSGRPETIRLDTHANVVFLTGDKAYKVKRAVRFPFLDYSTLELRKAACQSEIEVNSGNAPQIYIRAIPVTEDGDGNLSLDGPGTPVEWAVEMHRFHRTGELDILASKGPIDPDLCDQLAAMMVDAHDAAPLRQGALFYSELHSYIGQNLAAFHERPDLFPTEQVRHLTAESEQALQSIHDLILKRGEQGLIRRCHGDVHARNIVLIDGKPVLFDAIEFSDAIATNDVLYDLAFLLMDLWERGQPTAANRLFNRYLDKTRLAEHAEGLAALPFYMSMRAAIRAKIAASASANQTDIGLKHEQEQQARKYFRYSLAFLDPSDPGLLAAGGFSGTGKSTLCRQIAPEIGRAPGARILRTDTARKRMLGLSDGVKAPASAYSKEAIAQVYHALENETQTVLAAGHSAIFDAVLASEDERLRVEEAATRVDAGFLGLWLTAPPEVLKARVGARTNDVSDATGDIVDKQLNYDLGVMTWPQVDAGGTPEETAEQVRKLLL